MAGSLRHRGPDDEGLFSFGSVVLGHRRLSIIDAANGRQPMQSADGNWTLSYNGELYNFQTIRAELEKLGVGFQTSSDTEVIVEAFATWGVSCLSRFNGEFGIAAYDASSDVLHIVRDRLGIRNVYYTENENTFAFSSEAKALFACNAVEPKVDLSALGHFLSLRYIPAPETGFLNVASLPPAHRMEVRSNGVQTYCYWDVDYAPDNQLGSVDVALEQIEKLLLDSVKVRLMSDVPFGAYLSGGVDSSLVVSMMSRMLGKPVKAFTAGFQSKTGISEVPFAATVAKHTGAEHAWVECKPLDLADNLQQMVWHLDLPMADPACIPTYMVSKLAGQSVRMVLTGEGSDEIFGGYPKYIAEKLIGWIPKSLSKAIPWPQSVSSRKVALLMQALAANSEAERLMLWFGNVRDVRRRTELINAEVRQCINAHSSRERIDSLLEKASSWDAFGRMSYVDLKTWLPDDLLLRADRMCMAWSVEGRVPFLDHRLVELLAKIPTSSKLPGLGAKPLLKTIAGKYLPHDIVHRKKVGFAVPLDEWLRGPLKDFSFDVLLSKSANDRALLNQNAVEKLLRDHVAQRGDYSREIWSLLVLETWAGMPWKTFQHQER